MDDLKESIKFIDEEEKINTLLPELDKIIGEDLIRLEKVKVIAYRHSSMG